MAAAFAVQPSRGFSHERTRILRRRRGRRRPGRCHRGGRSRPRRARRPCCSTARAASSRAAAPSAPPGARLHHPRKSALRAYPVGAHGLALRQGGRHADQRTAATSASSTREVFDEFLRARAVESGATRRTGTFTKITRDADDGAIVHWTSDAGEQQVRARAVVGADGANSAVGRSALPGARTRSSCSPTTRSSRRRQPPPMPTARRAVISITMVRCRPISIRGCSARRQDEHRHRQRQQGLQLEGCDRRAATSHGLGRVRNDPPRKARRSR